MGGGSPPISDREIARIESIHEAERLSFFVEWSPYLWNDLHLYVPDEHLNVLLMDVMKSIRTNPKSSPFLYSTNPYNHPYDYYRFVLQTQADPVDYPIIMQRVQSCRYYSSLGMFVNDIKQLFINWRIYSDANKMYENFAKDVEIWISEFMKIEVSKIRLQGCDFSDIYLSSGEGSTSTTSEDDSDGVVIDDGDEDDNDENK